MLDDIMLDDESERRGVCGMQENLANQGRLFTLAAGYRDIAA
jgi:hypothetical protein